MQLTQEFMDAWADSVHNAWSAQPSPVGGASLSGWSCGLTTIAFFILVGFLSYLSYKEKMEKIHSSAEYKRNKQAHEEAQKERSETEEVSEG